MFEHGAIEVHDAYQNNLKHVDLRIPKYAITLFAGLSGWGNHHWFLIPSLRHPDGN